MAALGTLRGSEVGNSLDPDESIAVMIGGQGASRSTLAHLLSGLDTLHIVDTDESPNIGPPAEQLEAIAAAVERTIAERARLGVPRRAVFVGQSKGVAIGRALANLRPDLFKGGIGIGGACRNMQDLKPESRVLMEFIAKSQMLSHGSQVDESAMRNEWATFADLAGRPFGPSQFYVAIYVDNDGDEIFHEENCKSVDPNHLNIAIPEPGAEAMARLFTNPSLLRSVDPFGLGPNSPWIRALSEQFFTSPFGRHMLEQMLCAVRTTTVGAPRTTLRSGRLQLSDLVPQRIPFNHSLIGFSKEAAAATNRGLALLRDWPDAYSAVA